MRRLAWMAAALLSLPAYADVQFGSPNYEVVETDAKATVDVVLTNQDSSVGTVTVNYRTLTGSASSPSDYRTSSGTLVWEQDDNASKQIEVPLADDSEIEGNESFSVQLFSATGAVIGSVGTTQVAIADNDRPAPGEFQFAVTDLLVFEDQPQAVLQVRRVNGSGGAVSVEVTRTGGGTASPGLDFGDAAQILSWADGDVSTKSFTIDIVDDSTIEATETINYVLQNPTGSATITRGEATVSIGDNDVEGAGEIHVFHSTVNVLEGDGTAQVSVGRFGGANGAVSVEYITQAGTASTSDFTVTRGTLIWDDGDSSLKTITIPVTNDARVESQESFAVALSNTIGATLGSPASATVNIVDDDVQGASVALTADSFEVNDTAGAVTVGVTRSGASGALSVTLSTSDASATAGQDYTATSRTVSFADGETGTKNVSIPVFGPGSGPESDESFVVSLGGVTGGEIGEPSSAIVTIHGSLGGGGTSASRLRFSQAEYTVQDGAGQILIPVQRIDSTSGAVTVNYSTVSGTAQAGSDFTETSGQLTWSNGDNGVRTLVIPITSTSTSVEGNESFSVRLSDASGATIVSDVAKVTIVPSGTGSIVSFLDTSVTGLDRDGTLTFRVSRTGSLMGELRATVTSMDGSALAGSDYTAVNSELVWADGEGGTKTVVVQLAPPGSAAEQTESFTLRLAVSQGVATVDKDMATGTIKSYVAETSAGVGAGGCSLGKGDPATFGLMLLGSGAYLWRRRRKEALAQARAAA